MAFLRNLLPIEWLVYAHITDSSIVVWGKIIEKPVQEQNEPSQQILTYSCARVVLSVPEGLCLGERLNSLVLDYLVSIARCLHECKLLNQTALTEKCKLVARSDCQPQQCDQSASI